MDVGVFVWIGVDFDIGMLDGLGLIVYMCDMDGDYFVNKCDVDLEGFSLCDGFVFVSFEQDYWVVVFNLECCGFVVCVVFVVNLVLVVGGKIFFSNGGLEVFVLYDDVLCVGFEFCKFGGLLVGIFNWDGIFVDLIYMIQVDLFVVIGMDVEGVLMVYLFCVYDLVCGLCVIV